MLTKMGTKIKVTGKPDVEGYVEAAFYYEEEAPVTREIHVGALRPEDERDHAILSDLCDSIAEQRAKQH